MARAQQQRDEAPTIAGIELPRGSELRAVLLLAGVLALDHADRSTIGAVAPMLKAHFHFGNTQLGILAAAFSIIAALGSIPAGILTDRVRRTTLLSVSVALWSGVMVVAGASTTFTMLFTAQMMLGIATAAGGPTIASLTGDLFSPGRRGRMLGIIESGELVGTGLGVVMAGLIAATLSWRWAFWMLALPGGSIALAAWRMQEPERRKPGKGRKRVRDPDSADEILIRETKNDPDIVPDERNILEGDQQAMPLWDAVRYVFRVRTNLIVMLAGAFGNFFFGIIRTFGVLFFVRQYNMSAGHAAAVLPVAAIGAFVGIIYAGRLGDRLIERGVLNGRVWVGGVAFVLAGLVLIPVTLVHNIWIGLPFFILGGAALAAPNPPLDAARLDVIHPHLWGRAESIRTMVRALSEAIAPLAFGILSDHVAGGGTRGLSVSMLMMLPVLIATGVLILMALRTYPADVAAVAGSDACA
jgi:MFS family permease